MPMQKTSTYSKKNIKRIYSKSSEIGLEPTRTVLKNILAFSNTIEVKKCITGQTVIYLLN